MRRTWEILDSHRPNDRASRLFDLALLTLIAANVTAVVVGTVPWVAARWAAQLDRFELVSVLVFAVEYVLRVWSAPANPAFRPALTGRLRYIVTPMAIVDLLAIVPSLLPFVGVDLRFARALRLMRLFRLAKLTRYLRSIRLFGAVARDKREELVLSTFVLFLLLLIASSVMYFVENKAQPDKFSSIPATMWWAIATLTTVGYGDIYPITALGRLFGAIVAVMGIGLFALPTAILGTGFVEAIAREKQPPMTCPECGHHFKAESP